MGKFNERLKLVKNDQKESDSRGVLYSHTSVDGYNAQTV